MRAYVLSLLFCNYQHRCCTTITLMNIIMIWWRIWISAELKLAIHIQTCHRLVHLGFQTVLIKMGKGSETTEKNIYWYINFDLAALYHTQLNVNIYGCMQSVEVRVIRRLINEQPNQKSDLTDVAMSGTVHFSIRPLANFVIPPYIR